MKFGKLRWLLIFCPVISLAMPFLSDYLMSVLGFAGSCLQLVPIASKMKWELIKKLPGLNVSHYL